MVKAAFDPKFNFCVGQVRPCVLEIGTHGFDQLFDTDVSVLKLVLSFEIADNIADGATGRW